MPYAITQYADGSTGYRAIKDASDISIGETFSETVPAPSMTDIVSNLMDSVQSWMDQTAKGNGYDSLASCISYKDSSVTQWAMDASAALAWRDAVWSACFQWQESAKANLPATFPTSNEVIAQLPQPASFGWVSHQAGQS